MSDLTFYRTIYVSDATAGDVRELARAHAAEFFGDIPHTFSVSVSPHLVHPNQSEVLSWSVSITAEAVVTAQASATSPGFTQHR